MYKNKQKGFSLIVVFFVMSIMLVVVLSMISVLLGEMNTMRNIGDSTVAYYLAESGVEKTLYFDRQDPSGICNICTVCTEGDTFNNCNACTLTLGANIGEEENIDGCSVGSCVNCELSYNTSYVDSSGNKNYNIKAKITPSDIYSETAIFSSSIYIFCEISESLLDKILSSSLVFKYMLSLYLPETILSAILVIDLIGLVIKPE